MSKRKDYTQVKLPNDITAIKYLYSDKWGSAVWLFYCACGKKFKAVGSDVLRKRRVSCGNCNPIYVGDSFGKLTVLAFAGYKILKNNKKTAQWLCKCECGNIKVIRASHLKDKHTTSCGCAARQKENNGFRDLTKEILPFDITALKFLYIDKHKDAVWLFKCHCGKEFERAGFKITSKHTKSCGCLNKIYNKKYKKWFRSSWELNFTIILDYLEVEWQYEPKRFKLSNNKRYIPDFYLPEFNMFIEIKGRWFKNKKGFSISKEKTKLFKKEYPQYNYYVIDEFKYKEWKEEFKFLLN